jgi:hypothetical protein
MHVRVLEALGDPHPDAEAHAEDEKRQAQANENDVYAHSQLPSVAMARE